MASINIPIELSFSARSQKLIDFIRTLDPVEDAATCAAPTAPARIGERYQDGIYAGLSRGEDGKPDAHLVLLDALPEGELNWKDATAWAEGLGDGARLPTRFESALLYANLRDQIDTAGWYWTGTQYSASYAWMQYFLSGSQSLNTKDLGGRARAVRRLEI